MREEKKTLMLWVAVLALLSGMAGLVYEVLYIRVLTTVVGDMYYSHMALIATFICGIGIGARIAYRFGRHLWAFEFAAGGYAITLPFITAQYQQWTAGFLTTSPIWYTVISAVILLTVPALCMGVSIPLFAAYLRAAGKKQNAFGFTYVLYNTGAAVNILLAEYVLIRSFGVQASLWLVGGLNILCGILLLSLSGSILGDKRTQFDDEADSTLKTRELAAIALVSLATALFIGIFLKACYHIFLPHRENFAVCTAVTILAIAAGTAAVNRFKISFSACVVASMLLISATYSLFDPIVAAYTRWPNTHTILPLLIKKVLFAVLLGGLPYAMLSATIPALMTSERCISWRSGRLLFYSGAGSAVGYVFGPLLLFQRVDSFTILTIVIALLAASLPLFAGWQPVRRHARALILVIILMPLLARTSETSIHLAHFENWRGTEITVFKHASDHATWVQREYDTYLTYNGHPSIFVFDHGQPKLDENSSGVIPALTAPSLERAMVLGLGTGMTGGTAAQLFKHTDIVEINRAFFDLAQELGDINFDVTNNPHAQLIHDDGRRFLVNTQHHYDAIINSVPSPTFFSAGKIYTSEFFELVKTKLKPDGVYSTWFTGWDMSANGVRTLFRTLDNSFAHCGVAILSGDYYMMSCSDSPLAIRSFSELNAPQPLISYFSSQIGYTSLDSFFDAIFLGTDIFADLEFAGQTLNTDDLPRLEFEIMRYEAKGRRTADVVLADIDTLQLDLINIKRPDDYLRRAEVAYRNNWKLYEHVFKHQIRADPLLDDAFRGVLRYSK